jgi:hypothetical protein
MFSATRRLRSPWNLPQAKRRSYPPSTMKLFATLDQKFAVLLI